MPKKKIEVNCKNFYKSTSFEEMKITFTKKWIELINQFEKNKNNRMNI